MDTRGCVNTRQIGFLDVNVDRDSSASINGRVNIQDIDFFDVLMLSFFHTRVSSPKV